MKQMFLSQRVTKNEMEAKIYGMEDNMECKKAKMEYFKDGLKLDMDGLQADIEGLKEGLTKFLQKRISVVTR